MKKSLSVTVAAGIFCAAFMPLFSGCSADVGYILKTDENGSSYYSARATGFTSSLQGELVIPEYYGEGEERYPVKEIEGQGFSNAGITKLKIPATVEKIGTAAFTYCASLEEVEFADGSLLTEIPWGIFGFCTSLEKINLPDGITTIDGLAFYNCTGLGNLEFPAGLININQRAFENCEKLDGIVFPQSLKKIGSMAFYNCYQLKSIVLPDGMTDVEEPVLDDNGNSKLDDNGNPVTKLNPALGLAAFHTCTSLKTAVVGEGITVLKEGVFGYCPALEEVYLPSTLKEICGALISDGKVQCGHPFHNDNGLKKVYFAGSEEEWEGVKINETSYNVEGALYDNSALTAAEKVCGVKYGADKP